MGWDTKLDPKKLPRIQGQGFESPKLSMDEYVRFCGRVRMEKARHPAQQKRSLEESLPVNSLFRIMGWDTKLDPEKL